MWRILTISASSEEALEKETDTLLSHLETRGVDGMGQFEGFPPNFNNSGPFQRLLICPGSEDAVKSMKIGDRENIFTKKPLSRSRPVIFMFPGIGDQYEKMGLAIYRENRSFRDDLDFCATLLRPVLECDIRQLLYPGIHGSPRMLETGLFQTEMAHPLLFAFEYSLARLLMRRGIRISGMIGYSLGEYVAACLAGVFTLKDALFLVAKRAKLIHELPRGAMLAVSLPSHELKRYLLADLFISAINGPSLTLVSGSKESISGLEETLKNDGKSFIRMQSEHPFHSLMLRPMVDSFKKVLNEVSFSKPRVPFISNITGTWITEEEATSVDYWVNHLLNPLHLERSLKTLLWDDKGSVLLEVGPGNFLSSLALQQNGSPTKHQRVVLTSLPHKFNRKDEMAWYLKILGTLWAEGIHVDWKSHLDDRQIFEAWDDIEDIDHIADDGREDMHQYDTVHNKIGLIWRELLGLRKVNSRDDFFELGGNARLGIKYVTIVKKLFQVDLPLKTLTQHPKFADQVLSVKELIDPKSDRCA